MPAYLQPDSQNETDWQFDGLCLHRVWEVWFCEPHVCFVFVESFTFIVFFPFSFLSYHINFLQVATQTPAGHTLALSQLTHLTPNTQQAN